MLATVQALARQTIAATPQDFLKRFGDRLRALAASQDLLVKHEWKGVELEELIRFQLSPFEDLIGSRVESNGPQLFVAASAAQALGMAIHELATNASKYGALSAPAGRVDVRWRLADGENGEQAFVMSWSERGGPPVVKPAQSGFGSKVIGLLTESALNGTVELDYAPSGLVWRLTCPAKGLVDGSRPQATARPVTASSRSRSHRRILVVEDEPLIALEVAQVLTEAKFDVVGPTRDVAGALSLLNGGGCDAAVLDINLGQETSEPVAIELTKRRTPFVTLSGYSRDQQGSSFDGAPALAKPLKPELLIATLKRCLAESVADQ
jgi:two-component sensor histidine kinase